MTIKLGLCSDFHLDTHNWPSNRKLFKQLQDLDLDGNYGEPKIDLLIIAGDIVSDLPTNMDMVNSFLDYINQKQDKIIYLPGNHDFWGTSFEKVKECASFMHVYRSLNNDLIEIAGIKIFGGTLWFPKTAEMAPYLHKNGWTDFQQIEDWEKIFDRRKDFITKLQKYKPDIVISHHLPSQKCIAPQWKGAPTNMFFANDLDQIITTIKPKLWQFGHTHDQFDFMIGETRMVCAPRGYPSETRKDYAIKIVEI